MPFAYRLRLFVLGTCFMSAQHFALAVGSEPIPVDWMQAVDLDGRQLPANDAAWRVVLFLGAECPLAQVVWNSGEPSFARI